MLFVALALGALFSGWVYYTASKSALSEQAARKDTPDAFAENIIVSTLDTEGKLTQRLWADYSEHFPKRDTTRLQQPYLELYRDDGPPWKVQAQQGTVRQGGTTVQLKDQVEFHRAAGPANKQSAAYTDFITFWPERDYAETDRPVRFEQPGLQVTGTGMRAYLDTEQVELLANVHAIRQPKARNP